ncbi:NUDIX hydrolase [Mucilaginibacter hurinus]|uniref:NUDIX hydrolase n=2 Tax=Mucilaginibacter hurinus TaxID=2201324 RepID=A0A367GSW1_9SPHI|nr:NUDIX hydrolase [Mucilaginibacter hurinus]
MPKQSAGILLYKFDNNQPLVFLVHPGGPFWRNKNEGAWSVPKGEFTEDENILQAARREFEEETGQKITGDFVQLDPVRQKSGKLVYVWAVEGDINAEKIISNTFDMEWPPRSGKMINIPEVDKGGWFDAATGRKLINAGQVPLIDNLLRLLKIN